MRMKQSWTGVKVKSGPQTGDCATCWPTMIAPISPTKPNSDTSPTRPGRTQRDHAPIPSASGTVAATVKLPHGLSASARTTTSASTASRITMMRKVPPSTMAPAAGPSSIRTSSPSERPSRRIEMKRMMKSWTAPASTTPASSHNVPGR